VVLVDQKAEGGTGLFNGGLDDQQVFESDEDAAATKDGQYLRYARPSQAQLKTSELSR